MNKSVQEKIDQFKKLAKTQGSKREPSPMSSGHVDSLSQVIRTKKDADDFMAELNAVIKRS
ncbi:MAG: hypothetical protein ACTHMI_11385 [Mucilaginibacter sp.]